MARYFFQIEDGNSSVSDREGAELPSLRPLNARRFDTQDA